MSTITEGTAREIKVGDRLHFAGIATNVVVSAVRTWGEHVFADFDPATIDGHASEDFHADQAVFFVRG